MASRYTNTEHRTQCVQSLIHTEHIQKTGVCVPATPIQVAMVLVGSCTNCFQDPTTDGRGVQDARVLRREGVTRPPPVVVDHGVPSVVHLQRATATRHCINLWRRHESATASDGSSSRVDRIDTRRYDTRRYGEQSGWEQYRNTDDQSTIKAETMHQRQTHVDAAKHSPIATGVGPRRCTTFGCVVLRCDVTHSDGS